MCDEINDDAYIEWEFTLFNNRYIPIKLLGAGSYCGVWFSYDLTNDGFCALKIYNRCDYERAHTEIEVFDALKQLNIKNIVLCDDIFDHKNDDIVDSCKDDDSNDDSNDDNTKHTNIFRCLTMPLCGYSLDDIIKMFSDTEYDIPIDFINNVVMKCIDILNELHKHNYVHADIKPDNILLKKPSRILVDYMKIINNVRKKFPKITNKNRDTFIETLRVHIEKFNDENDNNCDSVSDDLYKYIFDGNYDIVLCDMGTTVPPNDEKLYHKYTIYYRAPETILELGFDASYDYWSLGCTIYELLTKKILFDADDNLQLLYAIISRLGPLPDYMISSSPMRRNYFCKDHFNNDFFRLRGYSSIEWSPLFNSLLDMINKFTNPTELCQFTNVVNIMLNCLQIEYKKRHLY